MKMFQSLEGSWFLGFLCFGFHGLRFLDIRLLRFLVSGFLGVKVSGFLRFLVPWFLGFKDSANHSMFVDRCLSILQYFHFMFSGRD